MNALQILLDCLMMYSASSWFIILATLLYIIIPVMVVFVLPVWNAGSAKVRGSIWNTEYDDHNIEVQWLKRFDERGDCCTRYHLIIDDKCVSKDTTTWGDEPEHTGPSSYSRKVLGGEILGEDGERHTVECALYHPIWRERLTKSIIDKIRCTFRLQVHIYVDAKLIYDSFYESEEERICEEREIERIESYRDEMARREGKEPFYTHRGKKYVKRT